MTNFYRFRIFIAVIRKSYFLYKILNNFFFIYEQITRRASAKSNPRVKFPRFYFSYSLLLSGSKISPLRVYFSQHVQLRKLLLRESIAAALSATLFFLDTLCAAFAFFLRVEFKGRCLAEAEIWTRTRLSFGVTRVGIANFTGRRRRETRALVCESATERIEVTNWNALYVSSRSLTMPLPSRQTQRYSSRGRA